MSIPTYDSFMVGNKISKIYAILTSFKRDSSDCTVPMLYHLT